MQYRTFKNYANLTFLSSRLADKLAMGSTIMTLYWGIGECFPIQPKADLSFGAVGAVVKLGPGRISLCLQVRGGGMHAPGVAVVASFNTSGVRSSGCGVDPQAAPPLNKP